MGYFRKIYQENPELLKESSNEEVLSRWLNDHPNASPKDRKRARQSVANLKSSLRRQRRKGGRRPAVTAAAPSSSALVATGYSNTFSSGDPELETLEEHIDNCIFEARKMERGGLDDVIRHLRRARVEVSQMIG
jgi:hypothetical protein